MIKVVLLDDEETIIEGLKVLIDWNSLGFELIGEGYDGDEGYEIVRKLKPDILITDIKMPGISGLELIDKAKTILPDLKIMILSGYDQFDYAKSALEKGVLSYLLKPVKKTELINKLRDIKNRIENEYEKRENQKILEEKVNTLYPIAKYKYAQDIFNGIIELESISDINISLLGIGNISNNFCVVIFDINYGSNIGFKTDIINYIDNYTKSKNFGILFEYNANKLVLWNFLFKNKSETPDIIKEIRDMLLDYNINEVSIGVSSISDKINSLPKLFREANDALGETFKYGKGITIYYNTQISSAETSVDLVKFRKAIISSLDSFDKEISKSVIENMFNFMLKDTKSSSNQIYIECINIFVYLKDMAIEYNVKDFKLYNYDFFKVSYLKENYTVYDSLKNLILSIVNELIDGVLKQPKSSAYMLIDQVQNYIKENYAVVTRESASAHFHVNPTYLSKIFKQIAKLSFVDFVTQVKMEAAKKMLISSPIQIQELSDKLGYSTSQYFTTVFENYTGLSPSKFRKKHMKG